MAEENLEQDQPERSNKLIDRILVTGEGLCVLGIIACLATLHFSCIRKQNRTRRLIKDIRNVSLTAIGTDKNGRIYFDKNNDNIPDYSAQLQTSSLITTNTLGSTRTGSEWFKMIREDSLSHVE